MEKFWTYIFPLAAAFILVYFWARRLWRLPEPGEDRHTPAAGVTDSEEALVQEIITFSDEVEFLHLLEGNARFQGILDEMVRRDPSGATALSWLEHTAFGPRYAGVEILRRLEKRDAVSKIRRRLQDDSGWVSYAAAVTLEEFEDVDSIPLYLKTLPNIAQYNFMYSRWLDAVDSLLTKVDPARLDELLSAMGEETRDNVVEFLSARKQELEPTLVNLLATLEGREDTAIEEKTLDHYGRNLTTLATKGLLPRAFFMDGPVRELESRLNREGNRSFVLVGPSGVGKTAILHELVHRMSRAEGEPLIFLEATTSDIMSGTIWMGQWQTKLKALVDYVKAPRPVVWYIPDINNILTSGMSAQTTESFADFLMPHIEQGELTIVGECTPEAYHRGIESSPPMRRLLACIRVQEPHPVESGKILTSVRDALLDRHRAEGLDVALADPVLDAVVHLADRYYPGVSTPGRAVDILKEVVKGAVQGAGGLASPKPIEITKEDVIRTLAKGTGMPETILDDSICLDVDEIRGFFRERIVGQDEAVKAVADRIVLIKSGLTDPTRPLGVFFFVGPTGVGKTELAKALATYLFGSPDRLLRLDMSEFKDYHSFEKLIGNPREPQSGSSLVMRIRQQPFAVLLLDELEKAHPNIYDLFLQVFDDGRLTDAAGSTGDFRQALIIMTSNLGSRAWTHTKPGFKEEAAGSLSDDVTDEIRQHFSPEFINRIDKFVLFDTLDFESMRTIAEKEVRELLDRSGIASRDLLVEVSPSVVSLLLRKGFHTIYGARPLKRAVEELVAMPLARWTVSTGGREEMLLLSAREKSVHVQALSIEETAESDEPAAGPEKSVRLSTPEQPDGAMMTLEQATATARAMEGQIDLFEERFGELRDRKAELLARSREDDFWADRSGAIGVLSEIHHIEKLEEILGRVRKRTDDLVTALELAGTRGGDEFVAEARTRSGEITTELDLLETASLCRDPKDRCDAFLSMTLTEEGATETEFVVTLADMYRGWARSRGLRAAVVAESSGKSGKTKTVTARVEGLYAYGMLKGETGLHVSLTSKKGSRAARTIVRTDVLPVPDDLELRDSDVVLRKRRENGGNAEGCIEGITALHLPTMILAEAGEEAVRDLLTAKVAAMEAPARGDDALKVIRRYRFEPTPMVRDEDTGLKSGHLTGVLEGGIDRFLMERLRRGSGEPRLEMDQSKSPGRP